MAATPSSHRPVSWPCRFLVWHAQDKPVTRGMKVTGDWYTLLSTSVFPGSLVQSHSLGTDRRAVQFLCGLIIPPAPLHPPSLSTRLSVLPSLSLLSSVLPLSYPLLLLLFSDKPLQEMTCAFFPYFPILITAAPPVDALLPAFLI